MGGYQQAEASAAPAAHQPPIYPHIRLRILVASACCLSKLAERLPLTVALLLGFRWFPESLEIGRERFALSRT